MAKEFIEIRGARAHNLKNIDVQIPRDKLVVITGLSGSGKSSLAFDTIYAEGQRRYVESLSAYARQFLPQMDKPDLDLIEGLSPAISIEQKTTHRNPRSTVGTVTEIYDYLRLLFARVGKAHCPQCGDPIQGMTAEQMVDQIMTMPEKTRFSVLSPLVRGRKGEYRKELEQLRKDGYVRVRVDGEVFDLSEDIKIDKKKKHDIDVFIDRLSIREGVVSRLTESVEAALKLGEGLLRILTRDGDEQLYSEHNACIKCGIAFPEIEPRIFSFNSPQGACQHCKGLGHKSFVDPELVVPDPSLSLAQGAIVTQGRTKDSRMGEILAEVCRAWGGEIETPFQDLSEEVQGILLYGTQGRRPRGRKARKRATAIGSWFEGVIPMMERRYRESQSDHVRKHVETYMNLRPCPKCEGKRLAPMPLSVKINDLNISAVTHFSVAEAIKFFLDIQLSGRDHEIAFRILKEIRERLSFLLDVGLDYLSLDRAAGTLSGGEAQRIRLATQIGASLMGVLYILDEPSIGLHARDNMRLIRTLCRLRDIGNTVLVVEHDEETMRYADHIVDMGPGAGVHGGQVVAQGDVNEVMKNDNSLTGLFLSGKRVIPLPPKRRLGNGKFIHIRGAEHNNLKGVDVSIPLGTFCVVTGVSGSGKSSLVIDSLYRYVALHLHGSRGRLGKVKEIEGLEHINKVINIDQSPIGRTPRSNPATYVDIFTPVRQLFTQLPESRARGYKPGRFSFNVKGGRCETCEGAGIIRIEMHFLPDVFVTCEECNGRRFNRETLDIKFKGKNISDILDMTVEEGCAFFESVPSVKRKLQTLMDVGLSYITLGQSATTLSGGEAQRIKLAKELSRRSTGRTLYILDEPTTGLHVADVERLLLVLQRLVEEGNTVLVIEHQMDVIKTADWIIDMGPEGGAGGGQLLVAGTPEAIAAHEQSYTGKFLREALEQGEDAVPSVPAAQPKKSKAKTSTEEATKGVQVKNGVDAKAEPNTKAKVKSKSKAKSKSKVKAKSEAKAKSKTRSKAKTKAKVKTKAKAKTATKKKSKAKTTTKSKAQPKAKAAAKGKAKKSKAKSTSQR